MAAARVKRGRTIEAASIAAATKNLIEQDGKSKVNQFMDTHPQHISALLGFIDAKLYLGCNVNNEYETIFSKNVTKICKMSKTMMIEHMVSWESSLSKSILVQISKFNADDITKIYALSLACVPEEKVWSKNVEEYAIIAGGRYGAWRKRLRTLPVLLHEKSVSIPWDSFGYFKPCRVDNAEVMFELGEDQVWTHIAHIDGQVAALPLGITGCDKTWVIEKNWSEQEACFFGGLLRMPCKQLFTELWGPQPGDLGCTHWSCESHEESREHSCWQFWLC